MDESTKKPEIKNTNIFDFLMAFGSGLVNLLKIERIICLVVLYLLFRDIYFTLNIEKGNSYEKNVLNAKEILEIILNSDSSDAIFIVCIIALIIIIIILIVITRTVYVKEIHRLTEERKELMHGINIGNYTPLKRHSSSERKR